MIQTVWCEGTAMGSSQTAPNNTKNTNREANKIGGNNFPSFSLSPPGPPVESTTAGMIKISGLRCDLLNICSVTKYTTQVSELFNITCRKGKLVCLWLWGNQGIQ